MTETTPLEDARVELTSTLEERERAVPDPDDRFRILVVGDFSGRESRGEREVAEIGRERVSVRVDRDNIEELPGELGAQATLHLLEHGPPLAFRILSLDDFHPDRIFTGTTPFAGLRKTRLALAEGEPSEFAEAASTVRGWTVPGMPVGAPAARKAPAAGKPEPQPVFPPPLAMPARVVPVAPKEKDALVEELLERSQRRGTSEDLDQLVRQVVAPHLAPRAPAERDALVARADEAISSWMRELLRAPAFRDLEAAWRALDFLVRRVDEDSTEVHVLDVSRSELAEDLRATELAESGAYKILVEDAVESAGGKPWSVVVGMWDFSPTVEDAALLGRLARLARAAGAPFLAAAAPASAGRGEGGPDADPAREALWQALRGMTGAEAVGLAFPRFLLRLPYGAATDPAEEFPFEEVEVEFEVGREAGGEASPDDRLLWGNPAIACAVLLSQAFAQDGWNMTPGSVRDVDDLPLYVHERGDGEKRLTPCAEIALSDAEADALLDRGLMPLVTRRGSDSVRVLRFQSIREPAAPLAGPWSSEGS